MTHEQADFDALASLLGAYMVDETSLPVLPRRMNRNVRAFLTLYGTELPFIDPRDLPNEPIELVTLVDTQSIISIKGMSEKTQVHVVDHHPKRDDLPSDWMVRTDEIGATTTLLVEAFRNRIDMINTIQATLLLLGIYEDTGSLTYTRTTSRDLHAAAYLLEHGASLDIVADFLNLPLSMEQQSLYERLRQNSETHYIHGQTILIAHGDAEDMEEELSTLAHKMRDLLDPDALFILVKTRGGVQLIARSTSDDIDVSRVADHFGGGGHERAAASLIKDGHLEHIHQELLQTLPNYVRPGITVAQIMSSQPQLLSPDTPVEEASKRMQRYGYEGYPVVADGEVIGLLTRRAVDRALSHKLNLTAANLMNAGNFTVQPGDSIDHLQRLMTETGWGQIPVTHPDTGQIIGIVTRTDLLKTLTHDRRVSGKMNLAARLESVLPPARLALLKAMAREALKQKSALYIVGGFVRDLLLERPSMDFDLVVEGDAIALAKQLANNYCGRITSHSRFGTAKWHIAENRGYLVELLRHNGEIQPQPFAANLSETSYQATDLPETIDLITARTEFYDHPTALPTVERGSIKLDLHRRDFTINTLALRLDGHHYGDLQDYWGGLNDLKNGLVRVLHSLSFVDDPTRILRAVRFEQRFDFNIEERTLQLLHQAKSMLDRVSGDRIRHEIDHILLEERSGNMLARLQELRLLSAVHKNLYWDEWLNKKLQSSKEPVPEVFLDLGDKETLSNLNNERISQTLSYILWLIRLPSQTTLEIIDRLKIPKGLSSEIIAASHLWRDIPSLAQAPPSQIIARVEKIPPMALYATYLANDDEQSRKIIYNFASKWRYVSATLDGHDLRALGIPPGPVYRYLLKTLRDAWLDGKVSDEEEEKSLLYELLEKQVSTHN
ncbi:MAG: CBS domain-containing protein [Anaerolineales bacterium]